MTGVGPFKLAYNANGLRNMPLIDAIHAVAKAGYEGIEISLHQDHLHPLTVTDAQLRDLQRAIADSGVRPVCLATGAEHLLGPERHEPSLVSPSSADRARRVEVIRRSIDVADALAIPVVNFSSGILRPGHPPEVAHDHLLSGIQDCLTHPGSASLAIEPEPGFVVQTTAEAVRVIDAIANPRLRMNMDIGHVRCVEDDFLSGIRNGARYSSHVHIEDIKQRVHHHEIPGDGDIDFVAVFKAMAGYSGYLSVELYHHSSVWQEALARSRAHLTRIMEQLSAGSV